MQIEFPGHDIHGCAPGNSSSATGLPGGSVGDIAGLYILGISHVSYPFLIKSGSVEVVHYRSAHDLRIACIRCSLSVGTVAGYAPVHIVELALPPDLVYLVEQRVRSPELCINGNIGIDSFCRHIFFGQVMYSLYDGFAEDVPCKTGCIALLACALEYVPVYSEGRLADVLDIECIAFVPFYVLEPYPT